MDLASRDAKGQQLTQALPQSINQHKLIDPFSAPSTVPGLWGIYPPALPWQHEQIELGQVPMKRVSNRRAHWG